MRKQSTSQPQHASCWHNVGMRSGVLPGTAELQLLHEKVLLNTQ